MLNKRTLVRINAQPRQVNRPLLMLIGAGSLVPAAIVFLLTSSLPIALAVLLVGILGVLVAYRAQKAKMITTLAYGNLQEELKERFSDIQEGCEALATSERIWRLSGPLERRAPKSSDATLPPKREPAQVGVLETPGIRTDIPIWGIEAGDEKVLFFPEAVLLYREGKGTYEGFSYEQLKVGIYSASFYEREQAPQDAGVVAEPTRRSRMPVVLYTILEISFPRGHVIRLQVSSRKAAARFARAFGVDEREAPRWPGEAWTSAQRRREDAEDTSAYYDSLTMKERARIASAYKTLGVRKGASLSEISAAYKVLARAHHPDKLANLPEEDREPSEQQMKEINAAYTVLKRLNRDLAGGVG